jgi:hypothetical protein
MKQKYRMTRPPERTGPGDAARFIEAVARLGRPDAARIVMTMPMAIERRAKEVTAVQHVPALDHEVEDELAGLRTSFPQFHIWRETIGERRRYVARRLAPGTRPHTVVTPDPAELRTALTQALPAVHAYASDPA